MKLHLFVNVIMASATVCQVRAESVPVAPKTESLFAALRNGETAKFRAAIEAGADVNGRDANGATLLMQAATYGTAADLKFLLARGADVNASNQGGHTALMRAIPDLAKVELLVEHGANVNAAAEGETPLLIASAVPGGEALIRYLIEKGADVNAVNALGFDAVRTAAAARAVGSLKILLDAGAGAARQSKGMIARVRPGTVFDEVAGERARKRAEGTTALMNAARSGCGPCVRLLLEHGADATAKTESDFTALHLAAFKGDLSMVKRLLAAGAPVNVSDDRGFTPLMMAANSVTKDPEVVRLLLQRGAEVEAKDGMGRTAADWARIGGRKEIVDILPHGRAVETAKATGEPVFADVHAAVAASIALLEDAAPKFFPKTGCNSCHNISIPLMALTEARNRGYAVKPASTSLLVKQTVASFRPQLEKVLSGACGLVGKAPSGTYGLVSLYGESYQADRLTDAIARCIAIHQYPDGHSFNGVDTRPPLSAENTIPDTAMSIRTMRLYSAPALAHDAEEKTKRARSYLLTAKPWNGDDYAYRLLGLTWTGATKEQVQSAVRDLIAQQRPDGGWAQAPFMPADAYETGLSLWALATADPTSIDRQAYRRGVDYLMRTQEKDGSWHVRTRAFGFQPYFESGFPHGHDQWISMAATAWSAMALMPAADREQFEAAR